MKKNICIVFLLLAVCACKKEEGPIIYYADNNIVAHRGAWKDGGYPQNSLASLHNAIQMKCAGSEFDVWLTRDDTLIVEHDPTYAGKNVEKNTYETLSKTKLFNGETLPTLRQYLLEASGQNQTKLFLEIKTLNYDADKINKVTDHILDLVEEMHMQDHIIYTSFLFSALQRVHQRYPAAETQFLGGTYSPDMVKSAHISGVNYNIDTFYSHTDWLPLAKTDSLILGAWTVNDQSQFSWLENNKFNYIITDEPNAMFRVIDRSR